MSEIPSELKYTKEHEWVKPNDDGNLIVGITDHAQEMLGDLVYVEMPETEADFAANDEFMVVESVKAASDVYAPVAGTVTAINDALEDAPETVNDSPYGDGWFFRVQPDDAASLASLLDAAAYQAVCDDEAH